ncbi:MAG: TAXI family TRAP transporter solute-binding subunit [Alphaproteobacteria bacterium]
MLRSSFRRLVARALDASNTLRGALVRGALVRGLAGAVTCVLVSGGQAQAAEELRYFHLLSGNAAGTGYAMAESIASVISGPPGAPSCNLDSRCGVSGLIGVAQSSPGPVTSLDLVAEGLADAALVRASLVHHAADRGQMATLRHVSNVGTHELHLIVATAQRITHVDQLAQYRIGVGSPRSEVPIVARALFKAAGLPVDRMQLISLSGVEAADLLAQGQLDAFVFVGKAQTRFVSDLLQDGIAADLPLDEALLDDLANNIAGTFKLNVPDPEQDGAWRQLLAFPVSLIVNRKTGAPLVSAVLGSILWQGNQQLIADGGLGPLTHAHAFEMMQLPLHEGAGLYFTEHGGLPRGVTTAP